MSEMTNETTVEEVALGEDRFKLVAVIEEETKKLKRIDVRSVTELKNHLTGTVMSLLREMAVFIESDGELHMEHIDRLDAVDGGGTETQIVEEDLEHFAKIVLYTTTTVGEALKQSTITPEQRQIFEGILASAEHCQKVIDEQGEDEDDEDDDEEEAEGEVPDGSEAGAANGQRG